MDLGSERNSALYLVLRFLPDNPTLSPHFSVSANFPIPLLQPFGISYLQNVMNMSPTLDVFFLVSPIF